ncbi:SURF1 family protein [Homoserinimonas aerilata]|uniref:SURF1-like protein n=1 Tax=Homoserinimonas aerilata TaxID=1162970 RepID=A0A542YAC9_9MICO|nr:SURF1 family cytochrome oxidase biogenesis protein [Homoserinimonas aerilata]TQL45066.1 SURF1 family protein [Homoserinimonas aerilata]
MWAVARRPRWIAALLLALAIAAAFAALGQWQLERSIDRGEIVTRETETVVPLESVAEPQSPVSAASDGQRVSLSGRLVPGDYLVLSQRLNGGEFGFWVAGHLVVGGADLAVAVGWAESEADAASVVDSLVADAPAEVHLQGRYIVGEAPQETDYIAGRLDTMAPAAFVNLWPQLSDGGIYNGYLVLDSPADVGEAAAGLVAIDSHTPDPEVQINWLNIFYAAEWVVFAGFAVFLWWRLVKDAWELETAEAQAGQGEAGQGEKAQPAQLN